MIFPREDTNLSNSYSENNSLQLCLFCISALLSKTKHIWGESSNQDRWWFIVWHNVYHPWVSKAQVMTEKHHKLSRTWKHSNSSVLVVKKITQEWSKLLHFIETDHKDANTTIEKTEIHSENEENIAMHWCGTCSRAKQIENDDLDKYKRWEMRNPCDISGSLGSDQIGGG